jgi:hypothetical protein
MKINVSKTDLENLGEELTYSVNIVASRTLNWKKVFDEVQEYLMGEHGSPTMKDPHRDLDGNLVFADCDGDEFGLDGLVEWHLRLLEEGKLEGVGVDPFGFSIHHAVDRAGEEFKASKFDSVTSVKVFPKESNINR